MIFRCYATVKFVFLLMPILMVAWTNAHGGFPRVSRGSAFGRGMSIAAVVRDTRIGPLGAWVTGTIVAPCGLAGIDAFGVIFHSTGLVLAFLRTGWPDPESDDSPSAAV